ncbi:Fic family protein [Faucicola atlantae]|uniref:Fic family protein n=1 Tax=Faucicola atlantae TaxID=34059 RepID=UPI0025B0AB6D|nr:Fic family protein [Moraxella atlantae]
MEATAQRPKTGGNIPQSARIIGKVKMNTAIPYNPDKLIYQPIFTPNQLAYLEALNAHSNSEYLFHPRNIEAFSIDFAHTSAVLEGNTYTPVEAEILLKTGRTAGHEKKLDEALMLENMRDAFKYLVSEATNTNTPPFNYLVKNLHTLVSDRLLDKQDLGVVRKSPVLISATNYRPSSIPQQLEAGLNLIASEYEKIQNPFEKAVYVHQNLAYLQYFIDHNKRTARNMSAYSLLKAGKMPVMFTERSQNEYVTAVLDYYESDPSDYSAFANYFISAYENVCSRLNINAVIEAKQAVRIEK